MESKDLFNEVKRIILIKAPYNLIEKGAPENEYDSEIHTIVWALKQSTNSDDLAQHIAQIFNKAFSLEDPPETYKDQAIEIFKLKS